MMPYESEDERAAYAGDLSTVVKSSRRRKCAVVILAVALLAILLAIIVPVALNVTRHNELVQQPTGTAAISTACQATLYPQMCIQTLTNTPCNSSNVEDLTKTLIFAAEAGINYTKSVVIAVDTNNGNASTSAAVQVCLETLDASVEQLNLVIASMDAAGNNATALQAAFADMKMRLSAAMEFHTTCVDAFREVADQLSTSKVQTAGDKTNELLSNALAFMNALAKFGGDLLAWAESAVNIPGGMRRRLLTVDEPSDPYYLTTFNTEDASEEGFPTWMSRSHRRKLLAPAPSVVYNVKVAADGTGNFRRVQDAVNAAPKKSTKIYIIYVKEGTYKEQVKIPSGYTNLMLLGDGAGKTVITGSLSVALTFNMTTFLSATLIVAGDGFLAKGITFINTAGASGHQAVAVRVSANLVAFYQCNIDSWQDTLYAHTFNQFYSACSILGTVDFIFGNGNAVFQNCQIIAKKSPLIGQQNTYTAQGKTDPGQTTGVSFQGCNFAATADLAKNSTLFQTYLGRPWKPYSTAVLLKNTIQGHVQPSGWLPWNTSSFGLYTSYFAEYESSGAGANNISARVKWSHQITNVAIANIYQAANFISGNLWLPATKFPYTTVLLK